MRAICSLSCEFGISAVSCIALLALRIRVNMSAIGSVCTRYLPISFPVSRAKRWDNTFPRKVRSIFRGSPGTLGHAGDLALVRELAQADPAEAELLVDRPWPP